jgi:hypothetical protein
MKHDLLAESVSGERLLALAIRTNFLSIMCITGTAKNHTATTEV